MRRCLLEATTRLLGDTIRLSDHDWAAPTRLPGWTRSHVAAHLVEHAIRCRESLEALRLDGEGANPPDAAARRAAVERGATLGSLELQIQLDTSAGQLEREFDLLTPETLDAQVRLTRERPATARLAPLARLREIMIHHRDLDVGFDFDSAPPGTPDWVLEWECHWLRGDERWPALRVQTDAGRTHMAGRRGTPTTVRGTAAALLGWITRGDPAIPGAPEIPIPN